MAKKKIELTPWDGTEFLGTEKARAEYLNAELADGNPHYIKIALRAIARARNMTEIAKKANLPRMSIYRALSPNGNPEYGTILKIVDALDMQLTVIPKHGELRPPA